MSVLVRPDLSGYFHSLGGWYHCCSLRAFSDVTIFTGCMNDLLFFQSNTLGPKTGAYMSALGNGVWGVHCAKSAAYWNCSSVRLIGFGLRDCFRYSLITMRSSYSFHNCIHHLCQHTYAKLMKPLQPLKGTSQARSW
jgi:hypothetical protein